MSLTVVAIRTHVINFDTLRENVANIFNSVPKDIHTQIKNI